MRLTTAQPARHPQPTIKALALAHLMFSQPDPERAERSLSDFGLVMVQRDGSTLLLRGTGPTPFYYVVRKVPRAASTGPGLQVAGRAALGVLTKLPGTSTIESLDWPSGGHRVRLVDPSGSRVDAIADQAPATELPHRLALSFSSVDTPLYINETRRPPVDIPEVIRLGHVVLELVDFRATYAWYMQHFGFIPSDMRMLPDSLPAVAFMRLDLGDTPTDRHTLALAQNFVSKYSHSTSKLIGADTVDVRHRILYERGWRHAWGLGRHIPGSQIFNYWQDSWGDKYEHYCDGGLFITDQLTGIHPISRGVMSQRGQSMPASFTKPKLTPVATTAFIRNLQRSPDLALRKLVTLAQIFI